MKSSAFLIFFSIVLFIYGIINYYIYIRGLQCTLQNTNLRLIYKIAFFTIASSYIISRFLERIMINPFTNVLTWIGAFWLGAMVYFLMFVLLLDILRLLNHFMHFFPSFITEDYSRSKYITGIAVSAFVGLLLIGGYINTLFPKIRKIDISIHKKVSGSRTLHIAAASDIHLGTLINKNRATYLVNKINSLKPDIIILAGDILDEDIAPVVKYNIGHILQNLKAPLGIYAITGNHEYIGGINKAVKYLTDHNINIIRDSAVLIDNRFYLAGREDRDKPRFTGAKRKPLQEILAGVDKSYPLILLDHQPFKLDEAVSNNVDLQLSGHTHRAQLWPFSYLTKKIYELDWGYMQKGNTHFYVSSGFGTWGPPMRIGTRAEILDIYVRFE